MAAPKIKSTALSITHKCRVLLAATLSPTAVLALTCLGTLLLQNILAAGWEAHLNTIKADAKGRCVHPVLSRFIRLCRVIPVFVPFANKSGNGNSSKFFGLIGLGWGCSWAARRRFTRRGCTT